MYAILEELAPNLTPEQVDLLFMRFQEARHRPLADVLQIMDLLKQLSNGDQYVSAAAERDSTRALSMPQSWHCHTRVK